MAKKQIFSVITPLGHRVTLSRDRWRQIIRYKHPALSGRENEVRVCLQQPKVIRESTKDPEVHLYYKESGNRFVCVVTAPSRDSDHFVVTAYFTTNVKEGKELWKK